jgi:hypothetical protein
MTFLLPRAYPIVPFYPPLLLTSTAPGELKKHLVDLHPGVRLEALSDSLPKPLVLGVLGEILSVTR